VDYPTNKMIPVNSYVIDLGKPASFPSYGWDNEYGERTVNVPSFMASENMITNGEFWHFVADGGYRKKEFWCEDGWAWRTHRNLKWPFFWVPLGPAGSNEYSLRTIFENISMPWDWPVDCTYYEAKAYCRWKTEKNSLENGKEYRLLTEAEHHVIRNREHSLEAARKNISADRVMTLGGDSFDKGITGSNMNLAFSSQNPVDYFHASHTGHRDTTGNAWEWTEDHFNPLRGFEVHHIYDDFSSPCFDGKHSMIVGGSFISTGDEASVFARFHFRPHFLQHSGFRLVESDHDAPATHLFPGSFGGQAARASELASSRKTGNHSSNNVYETDVSLNMYLGLHYPSSGSKEGLSSIISHEMSPRHGLRFPQRVAQLLIDLKPKKMETALDIGCAVGGASFHLATKFDHVDAFDFSNNFVAAAKRMQDGEIIKFKIPVEADIFQEVEAVHEKEITQENRTKVTFFQGDACRIGEMASDGTLRKYDGIIMSNLLCRLPDPLRCLNGLHRIVEKGGVVVLVTPFSWLDEFTPRSRWLGGFYDPVSKEALRSKDELHLIMEERGFEKIHEEEMPLIIREHQRKYQYIVSEATGWRKS
jgi:putative 4-mercaptohistidine N1-methyltranferase